MTVKEWLNRGYGIEENINSLLRSQRKCPTAAEYEYYENIINAQIDKLVAIKAEIELMIDRVEDNVLQILLRDRYINFLTWESIAENIKYESARWVRTTIHNKALHAVEKVLKEGGVI